MFMVTLSLFDLLEVSEKCQLLSIADLTALCFKCGLRGRKGLSSTLTSPPTFWKGTVLDILLGDCVDEFVSSRVPKTSVLDAV